MMKRLFKAFLPVIVAAGILAYPMVTSQQPTRVESSISPDMPVGLELTGWRGKKTQESDLERKILAEDTRFSKAVYTQLPRVPWERESPPVQVSIVYSGNDLNNSIHRPEVCLPAQGHLNVQGTESSLQLRNGKSILLTRLSSSTPVPQNPKLRLQHIHYYVFVGGNTLLHTHIARNLQDIAYRLQGKVQSWAYFQAGTYWAPELGISEEDADGRLRKLISELLPRQIDWEQVK